MRDGQSNKMILAIKIDHRAIDSLDRIAAAGGDSTAQVMIRFFDGLRDSVGVLDGDHHGDLIVIRDELAKAVMKSAGAAEEDRCQGRRHRPSFGAGHVSCFA